MIIDCHAHLVPQTWFHPKSPKSIFNLDGLFQQQDEAGVDITVFGNNWIRSPDGADPLRVVKEFNAHAAELTAKHPKRLLGLACSVPYDSGPILKETEKAIREYKLKGIMIGSSTNGEYLDSPRATPSFELVSDLDVPLFVHPPKFTIGNEKMEIFRLPEMLGRPSISGRRNISIFSLPMVNLGGWTNSGTSRSLTNSKNGVARGESRYSPLVLEPIMMPLSLYSRIALSVSLSIGPLS